MLQAFDFSAPGFIQLLIRKANLPRACSNALMRRNIQALMDTTNTNQRKRTTDYTDATNIVGRCSGDLAETISISPRSSQRYFELGNQETEEMGFPGFDAFKAGRRGPHTAGKLSAPQSVISSPRRIRPTADVVLPSDSRFNG